MSPPREVLSKQCRIILKDQGKLYHIRAWVVPRFSPKPTAAHEFVKDLALYLGTSFFPEDDAKIVGNPAREVLQVDFNIVYNWTEL